MTDTDTDTDSIGSYSSDIKTIRRLRAAISTHGEFNTSLKEFARSV